VFETVREENGHVIAGEQTYGVTDMVYDDVAYIGARRIHVVPAVLVPEPSVLMGLQGASFYESVDSGHALGLELVTARYAGAWALVHMLAVGPNAELRARFLSYLGALGRGSASRVAFEDAFGGVDLDRPFDAYVRAGRYRTFTRPAPPPSAAPTDAPVSVAQAHLMLATLLLRTDVARDVAVQHLVAAERDSETRAQALLVHAMLDTDRAEDYVRAAVEAAPDDREVARARLTLAAAQHAPDADALARAMAERADRGAEDDAALARAEVELGRPEDALAHAIEATENRPEAWWAWIEVCRADVALHRFADASVALLHVARSGATEDGNVALEVRRWHAEIRRVSIRTGPDLATIAPPPP
jgi:hypothetical protein